MRPSSRPSLVGRAILWLGLLTVGVVGTVGVLWSMGKIELPFLSRAKAPFEPPPGTVPVLLSAKEIPAYTRITRDHLFDVNGKPNLFYLPPEEVKHRELFTDINAILNRVTARDIKKGYAFRDKEFLPEGSRAGVAGGVPPGKRALVVEATKIQGIFGLKAGDSFDLVASVHIDPAKANDKVSQALYLANQPGGTAKKHARVNALVQNGYVVQGVSMRQTPTTSASLTQGQKTQMKPVQEIVIAVAPQEVAPLTEALGIGAEILAVYRSGQPGEVQVSVDTPGSPPPLKLYAIEVIIGHKRDVVLFPQFKQNPAPPAGLESDPLDN